MKLYNAACGEKFPVSDHFALTLLDVPVRHKDPRAFLENNLANLERSLAALNGRTIEEVFGDTVNLDLVKFTNWRPDTCGCELQYIWDRSTTEDARIHYPHRLMERCEHHWRANDDMGAYQRAAAENIAKNAAIGKASGLFKDLHAADFRWHYDAQRLLTISHDALSARERAKLRRFFKERQITVKVE